VQRPDVAQRPQNGIGVDVGVGVGIGVGRRESNCIFIITIAIPII
jgi:hypothetical protein